MTIESYSDDSVPPGRQADISFVDTRDLLHLEVVGTRYSGMRTPDMTERVLVLEVAIPEDQYHYLGLELGDTLRVARPDLSILDDRAQP